MATQTVHAMQLSGVRCGSPDNTSPSMCLAAAYTSLTSVNPAQPMNATLMEFGRGGVRMETAVTTPSVPSEPINNCFKSYPIDIFTICTYIQSDRTLTMHTLSHIMYVHMSPYAMCLSHRAAMYSEADTGNYNAIKDTHEGINSLGHIAGPMLSYDSVYKVLCVYNVCRPVICV